MMDNWSDKNNEEDWYPFDHKDEPIKSKKSKSIFERIGPVLGGFGVIGWGCFGCVFSSVCGFFFAAGSAVALEDLQDRPSIDFESAEAFWLISGWSALFFFGFVAISAVGFYLLRQRQ